MKKNNCVISDGAKQRLFRIAYKANERIETCDSDKEYKAAKKRSDEWNEIVMALGLTNEMRIYYAEMKGEKE